MPNPRKTRTEGIRPSLQRKRGLRVKAQLFGSGTRSDYLGHAPLKTPDPGPAPGPLLQL